MRSVSGTPRGFGSPARTQILTLAARHQECLQKLRLGSMTNNKLISNNMRRSLCIGLIILLPLNLLGQGIPFDKSSDSVIYLKQFSSKKNVAYTINDVTVFMNRDDYKNDVEVVWKHYNEGLSPFQKEKILKEGASSDWNKRYILIDSVYKLLLVEIDSQDTIRLSEKTFNKAGLRGLANIDRLIENGKCAIIDENNVRHFKIIRRKGSWYRGPKEAWGGRRYYLPKKEKWFYQATDWIS
jgi:hypothetical protein